MRICSLSKLLTNLAGCVLTVLLKGLYKLALAIGVGDSARHPIDNLSAMQVRMRMQNTTVP